MMSTKLRLAETAKAGFICLFALVLRDGVQAADSSVPLSWNVAPMRSGAYLESFDSALPAWANRVGFNFVTNEFPTMTGSALPARSNLWFDANAKVMQLETDGEIVTNSVLHADSSDVTFASQPVYVDLRIKFDPLVETPEASMLDTVKMGLFVSSDAKLVVVHGGGVSTNGTALDTNKWYQVTVRLYDGAFDVLLNDAEVFNGLTLKNVGTANTLSSANFFGTGFIDELYVGHGDPAYPVTGPTSAIPSLPSPGANPPTDEEQTRINAWLNGYPAVTSLSLSQDELSASYLLNTLNVSGGDTGVASTYSFGIAKLDLASPTSVIVTATLKVNSVNLSGAVNGKIQLQGKVNFGDAWTTLETAITPAYADFTDGEATYTFSVPDGYKFFKPLLVP